MKSLTIFFFTGLVALFTLSFYGFRNPETDKSPIPTRNGNSGFALVELFTSEGCSSCPAAEEVFERYQKEIKDQPIYLLAFHVDYWNRLGWKDSFSDKAYSERQNQYASWLNLNTIYTPQAIVNGRTEFVGSDESKLKKSIQLALMKTTGNSLRLELGKVEPNSINIRYHATGTNNHISLVLALVQKHAVVSVKRGENEGRTLSHIQLVRSIKTIHPSGNENEGEKLDRPKDLQAKDMEVIGFLQNDSNGEVLAAAKVSVSGLGI